MDWGLEWFCVTWTLGTSVRDNTRKRWTIGVDFCIRRSCQHTTTEKTKITSNKRAECSLCNGTFLFSLCAFLHVYIVVAYRAWAKLLWFYLSIYIFLLSSSDEHSILLSPNQIHFKYPLSSDENCNSLSCQEIFPFSSSFRVLISLFSSFPVNNRSPLPSGGSDQFTYCE